MTDQEIRNKLRAALTYIAPEAGDESIDDSTPLQEQFDLDSVDMMNYIVKVQEDLGVEIQNAEFKSFSTIDGAVEALKKK